MPTATATRWTPGPFTRLPAAALDYALTRRAAGATFPAILAELEALGFQVSGYTPSLLNQHSRRHGGLAPTRRTTARATRPAARRTESAWGTGRRFGLEIEVAGLSTYAAAAAIARAGVRCVDEGYSHRVMDQWKVVTDGSVSGCEVVSPPMASVDDVAAVVQALRDAGGRVDRSTGLHVHHEATDLSPRALAYVVRLMAECADDLDQVVSPPRRQRGGASSYCRRMSQYEVAEFAGRFERLSGAGDMATARSLGLGGRPDSRYRTLNVHSYGTYGTLEFRQHQGTLNARKVADWVLLGQAILAFAATEPESIPARGTLLSTLEAAGLLAADVIRRLRRFERAAA